MNLKEYKAQPDEGLYEKIQRRLRLRRFLRYGTVAVILAGVAATVWLLVSPSSSSEQAPLVSLNSHVTATPRTTDTAVSRQAPRSSEEPLASRRAPSALEETHASVEPAAAKTSLTTVTPPTAHLSPLTYNAPLPGAETLASHPAALPSEGPAASDESSAAPMAPASHAGEATATTEEPLSLEKGPGEPPLHADNQMWAPNVIVPDGDIDDNRVFKLHFTSPVTDFHIYIFNRGGRQLFTSTDPAFVWDGTHNGTRLPQGAYVWVAQYRDSDGKPHQEQGTVTLLR